MTDRHADWRTALDAFDTSAQIHGWAADMGTEKQALQARRDYERDKAIVCAAVLAVVAERDALIHDNSEYVSAANELATENQRLREALKCIARTPTKPGDDKAALLLASVINLAFAALAQGQGGSNAE